MMNSSLDQIAMDAAAQAAAAANDLYHGDGGDEYPDHANDVEHYDSMRRRKSPLSDLSKGTVKVKPSTAEEDREGSCRNQTGYIGVRQRKWGMFAAEIRDGDKRRWLGSFPSGREAGMAYDAAAISQKGCKAKTNFRYDDFASIPRKEAAMETIVRWDLLPKEVAERFPRPNDPQDGGGIDYATRRRADTYSEPSNCITSESYEQAPKRSRSSSGAAVHTGHGHSGHGHGHQHDHSYDHIKAAAANVASMHFGGPPGAHEYDEDEGYHMPINPHMYGMMPHHHHAAAVAATYMYEGAPMDDGSNVRLQGGRMCTREYEQRYPGGARGRPPAAPPVPMHAAGRGSVGVHPMAGRRARPSDDGMSGDGGHGSHPASPSMADDEHHHHHRLHHPQHHYAYDAHLAAGGGYAHPLAAHMMMYAGQGPTSGGTVLSTKHMAETMYMAQQPYMQPHAGLPYPHPVMHYSHEHEYDDDEEEDMGPGHAVTELDMQRWKGVAGGSRYSSGGGSDLAQVLKRVSDDGASKDPSTGDIHVDPHLAQEGAHAIVAAAVAVANNK